MASSKLLPAYLLVGPDEVKRDTTIERLKKRLADSGMVDFNLDERDLGRAGTDPGEVIASLNTYPIGAAFRLVILRNCDSLAEDMRQAIIDYLANPSESTVLLVVARTLAKNTKLYKAIAAVGKDADGQSVISCGAADKRDLPVLVQKLAASHGKQMSLDAAQELVSRSGDSTKMLDNELKKLAAMVEGPQISRGDVERFVARTAEVKPWGFLDAVCSRDLSRALEEYRLQPPNSEMGLFTLLCSRLRTLIGVRSLSTRGAIAEAPKRLNIKDWQARRYAPWAREFSDGALEDALREAVDVERALKGSKDSVTVFVTWISHIAGRKV